MTVDRPDLLAYTRGHLMTSGREWWGLATAERKERERTQRRESILRAAARLFAERPYEAVRVDDIALAAELAKGTVYLYFSDKDAIVAALGLRLLEGMRREMDAVTAAVRGGQVSATTGLLRVMEVWHQAYWSAPGLFRVLVLDRPHLLEAVTCGGDGRPGRMLESLEAIINAGRDTGQLPTSIDPGVVSHAVWALFVGGVLLAGRGEISERDLRNNSLPVLSALVRGLCMES